MNPFDEKNIIENDNTNLQPLPFQAPYGGMMLADQPSKVERFIDKASGSLKRILIFIALIAGLMAVFALFRPYLHFLDEVEKWAHTAIDYIFD